MNAREVWKEWAQSPEGRELAEALDAVEDDQLSKQAALEKRIADALNRLSKRADKTLVSQPKCQAETVYTAKYFEDHVELRTKLPIETVMEMGEWWAHYEDHNCVEAAQYLDEFMKAILNIMLSTVPDEVIESFVDADEDEDETDDEV